MNQNPRPGQKVKVTNTEMGMPPNQLVTLLCRHPAHSDAWIAEGYEYTPLEESPFIRTSEMDLVEDPSAVNGLVMEELNPIPPNENPFHHDMYNMGQRIASDHFLMFPNHPDEPLRYLILVEVSTGKRTVFKPL